MSEIEAALPDRPLSTREVTALEAQHDTYGFAPVGFFPDRDIVTAFVVTVDETRGYSLGFDRDADTWVVVEEFESGEDFAGVTERLRSWVGDDWGADAETTVELET